jgi:tetratricopeptide (TPR) repeat protein
MPIQGDDTALYILITIIIIPVLLFFLYYLIISLIKFFKIKRAINIDNKNLIMKPILSAALSLLLPGFGQIYNKEIERGAIYIILTLFSCLVLFFSLALTKNLDIEYGLNLTAVKLQIAYYSINTLLIIFLIFVYINSVLDAYRSAMAINRKILRIIRKNKDSLMHLMKLGRSLYTKQYYQLAVELYTAIIALYPTYALAHYNRAVVYYKLDSYDEAKVDFISAAKFGHKQAQRILKTGGTKMR